MQGRKPASCIERRKTGVEWGKTGVEWGFGQGLLVGCLRAKRAGFLFATGQFRALAAAGSVVERRPQDSDYKMGEVRGTFVELEVARNAMIGKIFCDAGFGNAEMISEAGFDGLGAAPAGGAAQKTANSDAQRLAWFDKIVRGKIGIAEKEHAGTNGSTIGFAKLQWRAS